MSRRLPVGYQNTNLLIQNDFLASFRKKKP